MEELFLETVLLCITLSRVNSEKYLYLYFLHCTKLSILMGLLATLSREGKNGPLYLFCYHNLGSFCICICICICLYFIQSYNIRSWREILPSLFCDRNLGNKSQRSLLSNLCDAWFASPLILPHVLIFADFFERKNTLKPVETLWFCHHMFLYLLKIIAKSIETL